MIDSYNNMAIYATAGMAPIRISDPEQYSSVGPRAKGGPNAGKKYVSISQIMDQRTKARSMS